MNLQSQLESILFVASRPLSLKALVQATGASAEDVLLALESLITKFNQDISGIHILQNEDTFQMVSNPDAVDVIDKFIEKEIKSELTRAQLETLTVIAYRGPLTRPQIEQIRGVNCALILRNLLLRGLVEERAEANDLTASFILSIDALRVLGIQSVKDLPEYETLHAHEYLDHALQNEIHDV